MGLTTRLKSLGWLSGAPSAAPEVRSGGAGGSLVFAGAAEGADWTERSYGSLARAGFMRNPLVYRCVRLIAETTAAVPFVLYEGRREVETHPMLDLLRRPNGLQDGPALIEALVGHLLLSGAAHAEASVLDGVPRQIHALRPDQIRTLCSADGWPEALEHRVGGRVRRIPLDGDGDRPSRVLAIRLFHPLSEAEGFAPIGAAQTALDLHNAATRWNKALLV